MDQKFEQKIDVAGSTSSLLARYAAGMLPRPATAFVRAHLEMKPEKNALVEDFEHMCGRALDDIAPAPITSRDDALASIFGSDDPVSEMPVKATQHKDHDGIIPQALREFVPMDAKDIPWRTKLPGFKEFEVGTFDGCEVSMFWIKPGRAMPRHTHEGTELFMVLDGSFTDETGRYARGDISIADESVDHRPVAGKEGPCIGFSITDAPLKLTGTLRQRVADLIG